MKKETKLKYLVILLLLSARGNFATVRKADRAIQGNLVDVKFWIKSDEFNVLVTGENKVLQRHRFESAPGTLSMIGLPTTPELRITSNDLKNTYSKVLLTEKNLETEALGFKQEAGHATLIRRVKNENLMFAGLVLTPSLSLTRNPWDEQDHLIVLANNAYRMSLAENTKFAISILNTIDPCAAGMELLFPDVSTNQAKTLTAKYIFYKCGEKVKTYDKITYQKFKENTLPKTLMAPETRAVLIGVNGQKLMVFDSQNRIILLLNTWVIAEARSYPGLAPEVETYIVRGGRQIVMTSYAFLIVEEKIENDFEQLVCIDLYKITIQAKVHLGRVDHFVFGKFQKSVILDKGPVRFNQLSQVGLFTFPGLNKVYLFYFDGPKDCNTPHEFKDSTNKCKTCDSRFDFCEKCTEK